MYLMYAVITLIIVITVFLLFAKIKIIFEYKKYPGEKLYTDIKLFYGFIDLSSFLRKLSTSRKKSSSFSPEKTLDKIRKYEKVFRILCKVYSKNKWYIRNRIHVEKLNFHLKFGLGDAAATGILTGAINSMLYWLLAFINCVGTVEKHYFEVVPVFNSKGLASESRGRITLRMINMLTIAVRLYLTYKKVSK